MAAILVASILGGRSLHAATPDEDWREARSKAPHAGASASDERNGWLATAERLEEFLQKHPDHLGAMRDLLVAYDSLLGGFGVPEDLPRRMARRLRLFEDAARPLSAPDGAFDGKMRAALFLSVAIEPAAARASQEGDSIRLLLSKLGQGSYEGLPSFRVEPFEVRVSKTRGAPPDSSLVWGETWFVASRGGDESPDHTIACVLAKQGDGAAAHWYLLYRSLSGEQLLALYGSTRPPDADVRVQVEAIFSQRKP